MIAIQEYCLLADHDQIAPKIEVFNKVYGETK